MAKGQGYTPGPRAKKAETIKLIAENRKARFDFEFIESIEAGVVLTGSEVKSIRAGQINLKDSYVACSKGEAYLYKAHISPYQASSYQNHEPERNRKLLLNKRELAKIDTAVEERGFSCVPIKVYFKSGIVKIEIAIARGKKTGDKRDATKKKDVDRELASARRRK
jgi:SsrA-binding protein